MSVEKTLENTMEGEERGERDYGKREMEEEEIDCGKLSDIFHKAVKVYPENTAIIFCQGMVNYFYLFIH